MSVKAGGYEEGCPDVCEGDGFGVGEEEGEDLRWVGGEPGGDGGEVRSDSAAVEEGLWRARR